MRDYPDMQEPVTGQGQLPQEKLVLPSPMGAEQPNSYGYNNQTQFYNAGPNHPNYPDPGRTRVLPEHMVRPTTPPLPAGPVAKLRYLWGKDPAYKVLMIGVTLVVLAGIIFASLVTHALIQSGNTGSQTTGIATTPGTTTQSTPPTFPSPGSTSASTASSQPPPATPTVVPATPPPSPTPSPAALTAQITSIPTHIRNNSSVNVGVNTNPGVSVSLSISYSSGSSFGFVQPRIATSDSGGNATFSWRPVVFGRGARVVTATVVAIVQDSSGQQARSAPAQVVIQVGPIG